MLDKVKPGIAGSNPKVQMILFVVFIIKDALRYNSHCSLLNFDVSCPDNWLAVFSMVIMPSSSGHNLVLRATNAAGEQRKSSD